MEILFIHQAFPAQFGRLALARGVLAYFRGEWRAALEFFDEAERVLSRIGREVWAELKTARVWRLYTLGELGELAALQRLLPSILRDAEERGDLLLQAESGILHEVRARIMADDSEGARRALAVSRRRWTTQGYHVQHLLGLLWESLIDLYAGDGSAARRRFEEQGPAVKRSWVLAVSHLRIHFHHTRGAAAVGAALADSRPGPLLSGAGRDARRLEREGVIQGYTVRVHDAAERGHIRAHIMITVLPKRAPSVAAALHAMPEVRALHSVSGPFDLVALGVAPSVEAMDELTDRIGAIDGVERTTSAIVLSAKFER